MEPCCGLARAAGRRVARRAKLMSVMAIDDSAGRIYELIDGF